MASKNDTHVAINASSKVLMEIYEIPRISRARINGDQDEWSDLGFQVNAMVSDSVELVPEERRAAISRWGWDESGLWVGVRVWDSTPSESHYASGAYLRDSVELFLAPDPEQPANVQLIISPGTDSRFPQPRLFFFDRRPDHLKPIPLTCEYAVTPVAEGYGVEVRIPWSLLRVVPERGTVVGARLLVNDHDGKGERVRMSWTPRNRPFHALRLGEKASAPVEWAAWTGMDLKTLCGCFCAVGPSSVDGRMVEVFRGEKSMGWIRLKKSGNRSLGVLSLPPESLSEKLEDFVWAPQGKQVVPDEIRDQRNRIFTQANAPWRLSPEYLELISFAQGSFQAHVWGDSVFPEFRFKDPSRVEKLLGEVPMVKVLWLNAEGHFVDRPVSPGGYGAYVEILTAAGSIILKSIHYRLPEGISGIEDGGEWNAQVLGFQLSGEEATATHAERVAERWWHRVLTLLGKQIRYPYRVKTPLGYEEHSGEKFPLLVVLHGSGFFKEESANEYFEKYLSPQKAFKAVVVYPMSSEPWSAPAVGALIEEVSRDDRIDSRRIYLLGFSMGAIGGWKVLLDQPDRFQAAVLVGGRMGAPADAARLVHQRLWVINGAEDPVTTKEEAQIMIDALRRCGSPVEFTVLPGIDHANAMGEVFGSPETYRWFQH